VLALRRRQPPEGETVVATGSGDAPAAAAPANTGPAPGFMAPGYLTHGLTEAQIAEAYKRYEERERRYQAYRTQGKRATRGQR